MGQIKDILQQGVYFQQDGEELTFKGKDGGMSWKKCAISAMTDLALGLHLSCNALRILRLHLMC